MAEQLDDETLAFAERMFDLAREGETARLAAYLDAGLPVNLTNVKGDTLLNLAAYHQHSATVGILLERDADVHRLNDRGQSALACATFQNDAASAKLLLAAGADPDAGSPTPRKTAAMFHLPEIAQLFDSSS